jgi:hypothetical protein
MGFLTIYRAELDTFSSKISSDVNASFSDSYKSYTTPQGIVVLNDASKEFGGGLVSNNYAVPAGAKFFGMDITYNISADDLVHLARNEMDLKITLTSGSATPIPNQANGSAQQNFSEGGMWQLDPTGKTWVDSGYNPGLPTPGVNRMQFRFWTDGTKWSVTGLRANGGTPFTPDPAKFANIPMITTNWGPGLHPQLQTEVFKAPWFLRQMYSQVWILASDIQIPWNIGLTN